MYGNFDDTYQFVTHGATGGRHYTQPNDPDANKMCWADQPNTWKLWFKLMRGKEANE